MKAINILHISDLHFGIENDDFPEFKRDLKDQIALCRNSLSQFLIAMNPDWMPEIIVISGDIIHKGRIEAYHEAEQWISSLLDVLHISPEKLIVCSGNHDKDLNEFPLKNNIEHLPCSSMLPKANEFIDPVNPHFKEMAKPYKGFCNFCNSLKILPNTYNGHNCFLFGKRTIDQIDFIILNSNWCSAGGKADKGKIFIGQPHILKMEVNGDLIIPHDYDHAPITIAVFHHPYAELHDSEHTIYGSNLASFSFITKKTHVILSGHTHGQMPSQRERYGYAYSFQVGALNSGLEIRANCAILQLLIDQRKIRRKMIEYESGIGEWKEVGDEEEFDLISNNKIRQIYTNNERFMSRQKDIEKIYVKSSIHDELKQLLKTKHLVIIEGMQGIGKTCLARKIALEFQKEGFFIDEIKGPEDIVSDHSINQLFVSNDIFGENSPDKEKIEKWQNEWCKISLLLDDKHLFLCTSPSFIIRDIEPELRKFFVINGESGYTSVELRISPENKLFKKDLITKHLENSPLYSNDTGYQNRLNHVKLIFDELINLDSFYPESIRVLFQQIIPKMDDNIAYSAFKEQVLNYLQSPDVVLQQQFNLVNTEQLIILLIVLSCCPLIPFDDIERKFNNVVNSLQLTCQESFSTDIGKLNGAYIDTGGWDIQFSHPTIKRALENFFDQNSNLIQYAKKIGGEYFIKKFFQETGYEENDKEEILLTIADERHSFVAERLLTLVENLFQDGSLTRSHLDILLRKLINADYFVQFSSPYLLGSIVDSLLWTKDFINELGGLAWYEDVLRAIVINEVIGVRVLYYREDEDLKFTHKLNVLESFNPSQFSDFFNKNQDQITKLRENYQRKCSIILSDYDPNVMQEYNDDITELNKILGQYGFLLERYDDAKEKQHYLESFWSNWQVGGDLIPPMIDGGMIQLRITCPRCKNQILTDTMGIPGPNVNVENIRDSLEMTDEPLNSQCENCGMEFEIDFESTLSYVEIVWNKGEIDGQFPDFEWRFFDYDRFDYISREREF